MNLEQFYGNINYQKNSKKCYSSDTEILPACKRIIVIGDIHGDWEVTKKIFLLHNLIDTNGKWIAEPLDTKVVQVGDIVDRGGRPDSIGDECSELKIMDFLDEINDQASQYGGGVYCLLGNHEIMNVVGNFTYAGKESIKCFGGREGRRDAFKPGGIMARRFACSRNAVMKIGKFLFVHAGFNERHLTKTIPEINKTMRRFLEGEKGIYNKDKMEWKYREKSILISRIGKFTQQVLSN